MLQNGDYANLAAQQSMLFPVPAGGAHPPLPPCARRISLPEFFSHFLKEHDMGNKVGGGVNPMHLSNTAHPFQGNGKTPRPKTAHMTGLGASPGGQGDKISANAAMRKKRPMQGPGNAA
jgi:hypothetical protein